MEQLKKVEDSSKQVNEMVVEILNNTTSELDNYMEVVRNCFWKGDEILDADLDKILLKLPTAMYSLIVFVQQLEMRKGIASEHAKYAENDALINATGTVSEKQAKAQNDTVQDRIVQLAYKTASQIILKKIDGAMAILDSVKKVQQRRAKEKVLTNVAGNAVGAF